MNPNFQITNEDIIIRYIFDDTFIQSKIISHLDSTLFQERKNKAIVNHISKYVRKYKKFPQSKELYFSIPDANEEKQHLNNIMSYVVDGINKKLKYDSIQTHFQNSKTYNALIELASVVQEKKVDEMSPLVKKLQEAVNFTLQTNLGLDAVKDVQEVLNRLMFVNVAIPSRSEFIRGITGTDLRSGGYMRKALSLFLGQTNIGKTIHLCNEAAYAYKCGYNILYITLELAEEFILQRIYANVTDIEYNSITTKTADEIKELMKKNVEEGATHGNLIVKDMPSSTNPQDIENLIYEIQISEKIQIDFLVVDYIGKMKPIKRKNGVSNHNTYTLGTDVAEQLRDIAVSLNIAVLTASQVTRESYDSTDLSLKSTADSVGINNTADLMIIVAKDETLKKLGMFVNQVIKNRFGPTNVGYFSQCDYKFFRIKDATYEEKMKYIREISQREEKIPEFTNTSELKLGDITAKIKVSEYIPSGVDADNKNDIIPIELSFSEDPEINPPIHNNQKIEEVHIIPVVEPLIEKLDIPLNLPIPETKPAILWENKVFLDNTLVNKEEIILPDSKGILIHGLSERFY